MRLKSTGLGATELFGELTEIEKSMSGVLMRVKITKPVVWRVRVFLNPKDLRAIAWRALMPRTVWLVVKTLLRGPAGLNRRSVPENSGVSKKGAQKNET